MKEAYDEVTDALGQTLRFRKGSIDVKQFQKDIDEAGSIREALSRKKKNIKNRQRRLNRKMKRV